MPTYLTACSESPILPSNVNLSLSTRVRRIVQSKAIAEPRRCHSSPRLHSLKRLVLGKDTLRSASDTDALQLLDEGDGNAVTSRKMFKRLLSPPEQSRAAKTVEIYGWVILLEGGLLLLFPDFMAGLMHFRPLTPQASGFLRLIGMLVSGFGMLYVLSGRLNAEGFVFATLIDRPFVAPTMAMLWYFGALPGPLALLFAVEDSASWLWTLLT